ncbi:MAG: hypothetical protein FD138_2342, partial [Planctomycetota bacterium]
ELQRHEYEATLSRLELLVLNAPHIFCAADFETCWSRIDGAQRPKSKKEKRGKTANQSFYLQYHSNARNYGRRLNPMIVLDTMKHSRSECVEQAVRKLIAAEYWKKPG